MTGRMPGRAVETAKWSRELKILRNLRRTGKLASCRQEKPKVQLEETPMFLKLLAVSALSLGMATSVMAQSSGSSGNGGGSGNGTGSSTSGGQSVGGTGNSSSNSTGVDGGTTGSTTNGDNSNGGGANGGGKSQDCNAMNTTKNTTAMKQGQVANPAASADCQ
jgi:hypothetical protein